MRTRRAVSLALLGLLALPARAELTIQRVTPTGEDIETGSQIVIAFNEAVVPLGRMERKADEVPVTITPALACQWRWLDPQTLACQLPEDGKLQDATRYTVEIRPEFVTESGDRLLKPARHSFVTQRPMLRWANVVDWPAPTVPVLRLYFNQPVSAASVVASVRVGGAEVEVTPELHDGETPYYVPAAQGPVGEEARNRWQVRPRTALPPDSDGRLRIEPGLVSAFGRETGTERRDGLRFHTFPAPRFIGLRCSLPQGGAAVLIRAQSTPASLCDPLAGATLVFNAPVAAAQIRRGLGVTPDPRGGRSDYDPWENASGNVGLSTSNAANREWSVHLPFTLKADAEYALEPDGAIKDVFGRELGNPVRLRFRTAHRSPALSFDHTTAVLEQGVDSEVPVIVTNLDRLLADYTRINSAGSETGQHAEIPVAQAQDVAFAMPLGVRALLGGRSGIVDGRLDSSPRTREPRRNESPGEHFFAEVTPWQVHVKLGRYDTLVWVTEFATGKPVADAEVSAFATAKDSWQPETGTVPKAVRTGADGMAELPGTETLDPDLKHRGWHPQSPLAVRVVKGGDLALLPLDEDFNVDVYRASRYQVSSWQRKRFGHLKSWGTTAQGVYRAGDAIQYKVYVRNEGRSALTAAPEGPYELKVYDPANQVVHQRDDVRLSAFGAFDGSFTVPKQGKVGWYRFELATAFGPKKAADTKKAGDSADDGEEGDGARLQPLRVLVSDFTPAPFKLTTEIRVRRALPGTPVTAALRATLHAGGAYANAPATLSARIVAEPFQSIDAVASKFRFDGRADEDGENARDSRGLAEKKARTDGQGEFSAEFTPPESDIAWGRLVVEASAQDDRGRGVSGTASVPYAGRDRLIGLRNQDWLLQQDKTTQVDTLVVDDEGKPVAGTPYYVKVERREVSMARIKDVGNVYVARFSEKWVGVQICKGRSTIAPIACRFKPDTGGAYRVTAMTRDTQNRLHTSALWLWSSGKNTFLWQEPDDYGLELVPEKKGPFKVGEVARFLVKNPYPGATALITTERYGVIEKRTQVLEGSAPVIEVPITADHLPGFYLSVVVQSPRVAAPPPEGDVDLGKPTFRMGYATVTVEDPVKRIEVTVKPEREQYKPRETAKINLVATPKSAADGQKIELAVAVLDEAVYDLIKDGDVYFDPYKGFYGLDPLDLANYSLLTRLVGRQKFEKKGATPGGDGGLDLSLRSVDKYVAYWNPSLPTDAQGHAQFEFKLPDNLTAWKVLVLAVTPGDRLGLGSGKLVASKLTELRPAMPNQVSTGDAFRAGFSVLNRGDGARTLKVKLSARQSGEGGTPYEKTYETDVALKGFERKTVFFDVAPDHAGSLDFTANAGDAQDSDGLKVSVPVRPRRPTVTAADYGFLDGGPDSDRVTQTVLVPAGSLPGGDISVRFAPTVLGDLDGAFKYLRDYPYFCWEQRLSKGVMAAHYGRLKPYLDPKLKWDGAADLVTQMYSDAPSFQAPSGGMTFWDGDDAHVSPYLSAYTALAFEWLRAEGRPPPKAVTDKLDAYLDGVLRKDVPDYSLEASSAVRAVALAALGARGKLKPADLERYAPALPRMGLFGRALFAQAALKTPGAETQAMNALNLVMARGQESAGSYVLRETDDSFWSWLLGSPLRSNCAALSAIVAVPGQNLDANPGLAELPMKLVRTITQARAGKAGGAHLDHWENTQENVFCLAALDDYARRYESVTPMFSMKAALAEQPMGVARFSALRDPPVTLTHPIVEADIGEKRDLTLTHEGQGRGYFAATVRYVEKDEDAAAANAGLQLKRRFAVKREGKWVDLVGNAGGPMTIRRGELVRVTLTLNAPSERYFVVVDDPVPGGLEPLSPDLATSSGLAAEEASPPGGAYPYPFYHRELRFDSARFFADAVAQGTHVLTWIGQAVAVGRFTVPAPHAEQMYDPDIFGNDVPATLVVEEAPGDGPP